MPLVRYKDLAADEQAGKYGDCAVCLAVFDAADSLRVLPECSHAFHAACIDEWFRSHSTCPLCRVCLARPGGEASRGEGNRAGRFAEDDVARDEIRVPADFPVVEVARGDGGAPAISGFESQAGIPSVGAPTASASAGEEEEQDMRVNPRSIMCSNAGGFTSNFIPAIRVEIAPAKAAFASMRRSSSVGTDLQLIRHAGYVVHSEGTQHYRSFQVLRAIAWVDGQDGMNGSPTWRPVCVGGDWGGGANFSVASGGSVAIKAPGPPRVWSTRWSFPNLRQIAPV